MRLPSKPRRSVRSFHMSPRRSHEEPISGRDFHGSSCPLSHGSWSLTQGCLADYEEGCPADLDPGLFTEVSTFG